MKKLAMASLLTVLLAGNVLAENSNSNVPFIHKAVPVEGLTISYNTYSTKKLICTAENFYKGYLFITKNGNVQDTGIAYGDYDNQKFSFTSIGSDATSGDVIQFHVDQRGVIKLVDTNFKPHKSYVSCFYIPEAAK
jgi:hypothetical protein